jgi:signal transduction histidine kinase
VLGSESDAFIFGERKDEQYYLMEVKDNGIGFDPDYEDLIFRLF